MQQQEHIKTFSWLLWQQTTSADIRTYFGYLHECKYSNTTHSPMYHISPTSYCVIGWELHYCLFYICKHLHLKTIFLHCVSHFGIALTKINNLKKPFWPREDVGLVLDIRMATFILKGELDSAYKRDFNFRKELCFSSVNNSPSWFEGYPAR